LDHDEWEKVEDRFRVWSFGVFYQKAYASEPDLLKRFVKALLASARPIHDREQVIEWHRNQHRGRRSNCGPTR